MKLFKFSSISFLIFFSLVLSTPVLAVDAPKEATTQKAIVIAQVNVRDTHITSQEKNIIKISFNIFNREGVQSGVKYGVKLVKKGDETRFPIEEYVFPEVLNINANTTIKKDIIYTAPAYLNGNYIVMVSLKNSSGLPLGSGIAGEAKLVSTLKTVEILQNTCQTAIEGSKNNTKNVLMKGISILPTENIVLTCEAINNSKEEVSSTPNYETYLYTIYGNTVEQSGGDVKPILFKAGEKKKISLVLPKVTSPQLYNVKVSLKQGETTSNSVVVYYIVKGLSASIQNFSLDKNSYENKDTAKLSLFYRVSTGPKEEMPPITLEASLVNGKGKNCITPVREALSKAGLIEVSADVIKSCSNFKALVALKDGKGNVLDQKELSFESNTNTDKSSRNNVLLAIFGILVVAGITLYFTNLKKK